MSFGSNLRFLELLGSDLVLSLEAQLGIEASAGVTRREHVGCISLESIGARSACTNESIVLRDVAWSRLFLLEADESVFEVGLSTKSSGRNESYSKRLD